MTPQEVRRHFLRTGGSPVETAKQLGISRSAVYQAVARANERWPLTVPVVRLPELTLDTADAEAIAAYVRKALDNVGVSKT